MNYGKCKFCEKCRDLGIANYMCKSCLGVMIYDSKVTGVDLAKHGSDKPGVATLKYGKFQEINTMTSLVTICPVCQDVDKDAYNDGLCEVCEFERTIPPYEEVRKTMKAKEFLEQGLKEMVERGVVHDAPGGERSIPKTVSMFNALTGHTLTNEQGWKFMVCLKLVRSEQGDFNADNYVDGSAFFGLAGEAASEDNGS